MFTNFLQVSTVADRPCDDDLCTQKSYQLFHETPTATVATCDFVCMMNGWTHGPSKLPTECMEAWRVDRPGVIKKPPGLSVLYWQHLAMTDCMSTCNYWGFDECCNFLNFCRVCQKIHQLISSDFLLVFRRHCMADTKTLKSDLEL